MRPDLSLKDFIPNPKTTLQDAQKGTRSVYVEDRFVPCPIYDRSLLPWGSELFGPAVIEQPDTTIWIEPWVRVRVAEGGNLFLSIA